MQLVQKGHRQYMEAAKNYVVFAGKNLKDFGLVFSGTGTHGAPLRDYSTVAIPGKNGELYIDNGRYMNIKTTYHVGVKKPVARNLRDLRNFLGSVTGYQRLEDSYHPEVFRLAMLSKEISPEVSVRGRIGELDLEFNCKPQRFLKAGEEETEYASGSVIYNNTMMKALPLIRVYGTGALAIGNETITINSANGYTDIDCDLMDAYKGSTNCNDNITLTSGEFFHLAPGENGISFGSGITRVIVKPRWWML